MNASDLIVYTMLALLFVLMFLTSEGYLCP